MYICYGNVFRSQDEGLISLEEHLQLHEMKHWAIIFKANNWCMKLELGLNANRIIGPAISALSLTEYMQLGGTGNS